MQWSKDNWVGGNIPVNDKLAHFGTAFVGTRLLVIFGVPLGWILGITITVSIAKELYDMKFNDGFSKWDLVYDVIGIGMGLIP